MLQRKYDIIYSLNEYKNLIERIENGYYTNFQAINHKSSNYNIQNTKLSLFLYLFLGTLFGVVSGIFLSIILIIRKNSI